jgi:hypothetical protein
MGRIYHTIYYCGDIVGGEILVLGRFRRFVVNQVGKTPRLGGGNEKQSSPAAPVASCSKFDIRCFRRDIHLCYSRTLIQRIWYFRDRW